MTLLSVVPTSREIIKPKTPTPIHLRTQKLSLIDNIAPPVEVPLIFFYKVDHQLLHEVSQVLKESLSETLVHYYPLAGRIVPNYDSIDCNDDGVEYLEAKVSKSILEVIKDPDLDELKLLLPYQPNSGLKDIVLRIQVNFFDCGGVVVGACIAHNVADGTSFVAFMKAWAATVRGEHESVILHPQFDLGSLLFPPRDLNGNNFSRLCVSTDKIRTRRFIFRKEILNTLKKKAEEDGKFQVKNPTRVEVVTSFIWQQLIKAEKSRSSTKKISAVLHVANLRSRMASPLPDESSFGNFWWATVAHADLETTEFAFHELIAEVRSSIKKIDTDYMRTVQSGQCLVEFKRGLELALSSQVEQYNFTSWSRFPTYEVDFGWGKPIWVCTASIPIKNFIVLMSTSDEEGIEVWVNALEEDVSVWEHIQELITLV